LWNSQSSVCAWICLAIKPIEISEEQLKELKVIAHQYADRLSFLGLRLPICLVVKCNEQQEALLHQISGDQEWSRSDFSIQPVITEDAKIKLLEYFRNDTLQIFDSVNPLTDQVIGNKLKELSQKKKEKYGQFLERLSMGLQSSSGMIELKKFEEQIASDYKSYLDGNQ